MTADEFEQKWPNHLVILRHGQSEKNLAKQQAQEAGSHSTFGSGLRDADEPLTDKGRVQARATGMFLASRYAFDAVFTSPYLRTLQTTEEVLKAFAISPSLVREERLREIEFGILDGLTSDGIKAEYPKEWERRKREEKYWYRPPGGESRPDVALRVHSFLGTLTREYRQKSVLIVCHSVVVLIFRRLLERWGEREYLEVDRENDVRNCAVTAYHFDSFQRKLILACYNEIHY